ncbi:uncharacterized protein LOC128720936 [Anopheles nili]|uniref:uncharacterized protein LOC128720936 n=1 Tax=Anopheles nili TaxID=185578 RepID=UPI00237BE4EA|nr:uncharacterized protein LOC128720936 [Anopheles nili]
MYRTVVLFALLSVLVTAEPPLRFRSRAVFSGQRPNSRFARLESAPQQQDAQPAAAGYDYPKPMSSGYHYPKPDQAFPLPGEEMPPAFTTEATPETMTTTVAAQEEQDVVTTTAAYEDYEDNAATLEPAPESDPSAKLRRRPQAVSGRRPAPLTLASRFNQRLEERNSLPQQPLQPVYLVNLPEPALQQLILLNNAQLAGLQLAPQPTAVYLSELDYVYKKK